MEVRITSGMVSSFHRAISDSDLGQADVADLTAGLTAVFKNSEIDTRFAGIDFEMLNEDLRGYRAQIAKLRVALEAAHKDTRRIDYLAANPRIGGMHLPDGSVREIIDAAMPPEETYVKAGQ